MSIKRPENGSLMGGQGIHIQVTGTIRYKDMPFRYTDSATLIQTHGR